MPPEEKPILDPGPAKAFSRPKLRSLPSTESTPGTDQTISQRTAAWRRPEDTTSSDDAQPATGQDTPLPVSEEMMAALTQRIAAALMAESARGHATNAPEAAEPAGVTKGGDETDHQRAAPGHYVPRRRPHGRGGNSRATENLYIRTPVDVLARFRAFGEREGFATHLDTLVAIMDRAQLPHE